MRQRRWLELIKDYDCEILYHPGKANVEADALSRKGSEKLSMLTTQNELIIAMAKMELEVKLPEEAVEMLFSMETQPTIVERVRGVQLSNEECKQMQKRIEDEEKTEYNLDKEGLLRFEGRIWVPNDPELREEIMMEAHSLRYSIHLGSTKMYQDLRQNFWWPNMKREIAEYVSRCLTCQKVKSEHQRPSGLLQPLEIPEWKWEHITMDFVVGLPATRKGYDAIWVIVDRLTKSAHFLPIGVRYNLD